VVGTVPAAGIVLGFNMRSMQAQENKTDQRRIYTISEIPFHPTASKSPTPVDVYPRDQYELKIGEIRQSVTDLIISFQEPYEKLQDTLSIGKAHTEATIEYIQHEENQVIKLITVAVSSSAGYILGRRRSIFRGVIYASVLGGSMLSLCYPKEAVATSVQAWDAVKDMYKSAWEASPAEIPENVPMETANQVSQEEQEGIDLDKALKFVSQEIVAEAPADAQAEAAVEVASESVPEPAPESVSEPVKVAESVAESVAEPVQVAESVAESVSEPVPDPVPAPPKRSLEGDPGQSNPEDKDMYSTRSS